MPANATFTGRRGIVCRTWSAGQPKSLIWLLDLQVLGVPAHTLVKHYGGRTLLKFQAQTQEGSPRGIPLLTREGKGLQSSSLIRARTIRMDERHKEAMDVLICHENPAMALLEAWLLGCQSIDLLQLFVHRQLLSCLRLELWAVALPIHRVKASRGNKNVNQNNGLEHMAVRTRGGQLVCRKHPMLRLAKHLAQHGSQLLYLHLSAFLRPLYLASRDSTHTLIIFPFSLYGTVGRQVLARFARCFKSYFIGQPIMVSRFDWQVVSLTRWLIFRSARFRLVYFLRLTRPLRYLRTSMDRLVGLEAVCATPNTRHQDLGKNSNIVSFVLFCLPKYILVPVPVELVLRFEEDIPPLELEKMLVDFVIVALFDIAPAPG